MRERDLGTAAASVLAWAGAAAFLVCLLVRKIAPYPRWDLLACAAFSVCAVSAWWLRATGRWRSRLGPVVPPALGLPRGRGWWPPLRTLYTTLAAFALFLPLALLAFSTGDNTPQLAAITRHDHRFTPVTIEKVHYSHRNQSKTGTTYTSLVTVEAPGPDKHGTALRLKGKATTSGRLTAGERMTGGLYAPEVPSLGVILINRQQLDSLLGGPASPGEVGLLALFSTLPLTVLLLSIRDGSGGGVGAMTPESVLGEGPGRRLRVHIAGGTAGRCRTSPDLQKASRHPQNASRHSRMAYRHPQKDPPDPEPRLLPALRLSSPEGIRDLFLDRCLDPQALAVALEGQAGWLYWAPVAEQPPDWCVGALLVLDEDRYVYGVTRQGSTADLPQGEPVALPLPDTRPLRAVGPYALWQPAVHGPGACCFGLGLLAVCLLVAGVGSDGGPLLSLCSAAAVGGPVAGLALILWRRTLALRRLARS